MSTCSQRHACIRAKAGRLTWPPRRHHHAVGLDHHVPWGRGQRPGLFGKAFAAEKGALDRAEIMNPCVLADGL
jgi:hypothetical protein